MAVTRSIPSPASARSNRAGRKSESRRPATRSLSRITEDDSLDEADADATPRQTKHRRQASFASENLSRRSKSHTAMSVTERGSDAQTPLAKRARLRPSLAGPQVHEMNVETRAQILIPIAEDCIVQLLRAGLNGTIYKRSADQSWRHAWDSLQSQRRNRLFSPDSLPFNDFEDVREAFHSAVRSRINTASLERAIHLSNLATFLWVILQPDEAHTLLGGLEERTQPTRSSRRLGGRSVVEEALDIRDIVSRRNRVFGMAWKRYWKDVIPQSMRGNKHAIQLWAQLSVQIMMIFRLASVDGKFVDNMDEPLPKPETEVVAELFSASSIARYGQWSTETPSARDGEIKENAQRRWTEVARHRRTELREVKENVLVERYPYDEFRREMLAFIDEAVLHTLISHSASPRKPVLDDLASLAASSEDEDAPSQDDKEGDTEDEGDRITPRLADDEDDEDAEHEPAADRTQSDAESEQDFDVDIDLDLDLDFLNQVLHEMTPDDLESQVADEEQAELETDDNDFPSDLNSEGEDHDDATQRPGLDRPDELDTVEDDITVDLNHDQEDLESAHASSQGDDELVTDSDDFPSDINSGDEEPKPAVEEDEEEDSDWVVKEAPIPHTRTRNTQRNFEFAARQISAEQVAWDSQSQSHTPRRIARTPLFLPHQASDSDTNRSASATPRAKASVRPIISATSANQPRHDIANEQEAHDSEARGRPDDLEDMMPGSSVLGTPVQVDQAQGHDSVLAPSPMRRDQPAEIGRGRLAERGLDVGAGSSSHEAIGVADDPPSNSPSPQRPSAAGVGVDMLKESHVPIPSNQVKVSSSNRLAARSQRALVDPRKRRRLAVDFAIVSSSSSGSGDDIQIQDLPPIHAATSPRASIRRPHTPPRDVPDKVPKDSPRSPLSRRDFIIIPRKYRPAPAPNHDNRFEQEQDIGSHHSPRSLSRSDHDNVGDIEYVSEDSRSPPPRSPLILRDEFMYDEDESPLEPDPTYVVPRGHKPVASTLHGQIEGQVSGYSRFAGQRRWTDEEQLLLYRTVQKVPLDQQYPLNVVWHLYGEYGTKSDQLQDFNTQHMKDKMKTIVHTRYNNGRLVEGRARFWLPPVRAARGDETVPHPDKVELQELVDQAVKERVTEERGVYLARREEKLRLATEAQAAKKAEQARKAKRNRKKGKKRAARRDLTEDEESEEDEEDAKEEEIEDAAIADDEEGETETRDRGQSTRSRGESRTIRSQPAAKRKPGQTTTATVNQLAPMTDTESEPGAQSEVDDEQAQSVDEAQTQDGDVGQPQRVDVDSDRNIEQSQHHMRPSQATSTEPPPRRRRRIPYVDLPASRSSSTSKAQQAMKATDVERNATSTKQIQIHDRESGLSLQDSLETVYQPRSKGKLMRRTARTQPFEVSEDDTDSQTDTDEDDETEDDATPTGDDANPSQTLDDAHSDGHAEIAAAESVDNALGDQSANSSELDEDEKNAQLADMYRLRQKVLAGEAP